MIFMAPPPKKPEPESAAQRAPEFGFWEAEGFKLPVSFDDPDPEIESLFNGDDDAA